MRKLLFLCLFLFSALVAHKPMDKYKYPISVVAMFQNEAPYLKEWIEYHSLIGVKHFYLYSNHSDDNYQEVLEPYIKKGIVELFEWNYENVNGKWLHNQYRAYEDCLERSQGKTAWLGVIDIDEFIVPVKSPDLTSFLKQYDDEKEIGGIRVNWQLFGTSGVKKINKNTLMIEALTMKAPVKYRRSPSPCNIMTKCILRPHVTEEIHVHHSNLKKGYKFVHDRPGIINVKEIQINHYWTRDEDFFYKTKIERKLRAKGENHRKIMMQKLNDLNKVEDKTIFKYVPELRKRMGLDKKT